MIHRSIISTMERMVAHLLEVHNGALPPWLAPTQVRIISVEPVPPEYLIGVRDAYQRLGLRVDLDVRNASLGARIRDATTSRIPYVAVIGPKEAGAGTVSLRLRGGRQLDPLAVQDTASLISDIVATRSVALTAN